MLKFCMIFHYQCNYSKLTFPSHLSIVLHMISVLIVDFFFPVELESGRDSDDSIPPAQYYRGLLDHGLQLQESHNSTTGRLNSKSRQKNIPNCG